MWFGLSVMVAMVAGLIVWCIWAVRRDKEAEGLQENQGAQEK